MDILGQGSWAHGVKLALKAYTRASDAYALDMPAASVALWSLLIAAGIVLLEWLVARRAARG